MIVYYMPARIEMYHNELKAKTLKTMYVFDIALTKSEDDPLVLMLDSVVFIVDFVGFVFDFVGFMVDPVAFKVWCEHPESVEILDENLGEGRNGVGQRVWLMASTCQQESMHILTSACKVQSQLYLQNSALLVQHSVLLHFDNLPCL